MISSLNLIWSSKSCSKFALLVLEWLRLALLVVLIVVVPAFAVTVTAFW
jgi:hypothetical protein